MQALGSQARHISLSELLVALSVDAALGQVGQVKLLLIVLGRVVHC